MLFGNIPGYTYTPSEMLNKISNKIIKDTGLGANKEDTDINVDTDLDSAIGITPHKSDSDETHEKVETEHVEDNQVEESHENPVQEDGINEETIDENTTEAEIDAESEISSE